MSIHVKMFMYLYIHVPVVCMLFFLELVESKFRKEAEDQEVIALLCRRDDSGGIMSAKRR